MSGKEKKSVTIVLMDLFFLSETEKNHILIYKNIWGK